MSSQEHGVQPPEDTASLNTKSSRLNAILLVTVTLVLSTLVVRHTLAAYLVRVAPEFVLAVRPTHPEALLRIAERELAALTAENGAEALQMKGLARTPQDALQPSGTGDKEPANPVRKAPETLQILRHTSTTLLREQPLSAQAFLILGTVAPKPQTPNPKPRRPPHRHVDAPPS